MKLKQQYFFILMALVLVAAAFSAGTVAGLAAGRGRLLQTIARVAQMTSGTFSHHQDLDIPGVTNLNALEVIWEVREKVKQQFVNPIKDDNKLTYGAVRGMLAALEDPYTRFLDPEEFKEFRTDTSGHFDGIGAVLESRANDKGREQVVISSILEEGPAAKTNLRPKDIIVKVDKTLVDGMTLTQVVKLIRGPRGTPVTITVIREGAAKPIEVTVIRANIEVKVVKPAQEPKPGEKVQWMMDPEKKIGYIWLTSFNQNATREMQTALNDLAKQGMKGLILDLSSDPGGILDVAVEVASFFISDGPIVWTRERGAEPQALYAIPGKAIPKNVKMVTIVDGGSASASEIVSGALQDTKRSLIVGQHSFGKSKVQTICELQDQSALFLSTAVYLTPKLRDIGEKDANGKRGVKPDVLFPDPDPNDPNFKAKEWHEQQIGLAKAELLKQMGQ
ncbi:MAG: S41 family peptidase [Armatimonadetes bacterium]|nr:S41 family peptidase [Armatimonadota bacterium]